MRNILLAGLSLLLLACSASPATSGDGGRGKDAGPSTGSTDLLVPPVDDLAVAGDLSTASCSDQVQDGSETDVDCGGSCGPCADGFGCIAAGDCTSKVCSGGKCQAPTCMDGVQNNDETDVDCGGKKCNACSDGLTCKQPSDCQSLQCSMGDGGTQMTCAASSCSDQIKNGLESDVDCGGGACPPCAPGKACASAKDCSSGNCVSGTCAAPSCSDKVRNGGETDVDCGGPMCPACADGQTCRVGTDCTAGVCMGGQCTAASCMDGIKNGSETDVDCGGTCKPCVDGRRCTAAKDCVSGVCAGAAGMAVCLAPTCMDTVQNGTETDVDCGGASCPGCQLKQTCKVNGDCVSQLCQAGTAGAPSTCAASCPDGRKDGLETDVDCGGKQCGPCGNGKMCLVASDCTSGVCKAGACQPPSCSDGVKNGAESDVDCGGPTCGACADGAACGVGADCASHICTNSICAKATCSDGVKNGAETDVDCGGGTCAACANGKGCAKGADCQSAVCTNQVCGAASCSDGVRNGSETDVDCGGGTCKPCTAGKACSVGADCDDGQCSNGVCVGSCSDGVRSGAETDVDCGGPTQCARCIYAKACDGATDCQSQVCLAGLCRPHSCLEAKSENKVAASGAYDISPDGKTVFKVWCDQVTDSGGWTVLSINGDLTAQTCKHRLKSDAPTCGPAVPTLTTDWQLAGALQNLIKFKEILFEAYDSQGAFYAGSKLPLAQQVTVGGGAFSGMTPIALGNSRLACDTNQYTFSTRTEVAVGTDGYTVWGSKPVVPTQCASTGHVQENMGLNVAQTSGGSHFDSGWDSDDVDGTYSVMSGNTTTYYDCTCYGAYTPADLTSRPGFFAVR